MAHAAVPTTGTWTAVDLVTRFGAIPLSRVRLQPTPGTATEQDVIGIREHEDRLYELVDGVLVEKAMGIYESYLAALLVQFLGAFARENRLGVVMGADGMVRLAPDLVRIPDVSFLSWARLPHGQLPHTIMSEVAPDLAVEVISKSNTREEMEKKLHDYFAAGVRLVWYVHPDARQVHVYQNPQQQTVVGLSQTLDGGEILPGFRLPLASLFAEPQGEA